MKAYRRFSSAGPIVIVLAVGFLAVASPGSILAQSGVVKPSQLTRYTVPTRTWATPIFKGFQWFYLPETYEKTRPLFAYKLSQIYFDKTSICSSPGIAGYSQYDAGTAALVYMGQEYDGFPLGSRVDSKTLKTLGRKVAMSRVLEKKGFDVGTDFRNAKTTIDDFVAGLQNTAPPSENLVDTARKYYETTWIPSSPSARNLMEQMIRKAKESGGDLESEHHLSDYWHTQADKAVKELDAATDQSTKMLQFIVNAVKTNDKTSKLTLTQLCELSDFIASRRQALGDSFLLATKQPLPKVVPDTRLTGPQPLRIITAGQNKASRHTDTQGKN